MRTFKNHSIWFCVVAFIATFFMQSRFFASDEFFHQEPKIYDQGTARILTLDGGGMKVIFTACILVALEKKTKKRISEMFHLIVGTSAGGIVSTFLTHPDENNPSYPKYTAEDLLSMLIQKSGRVFTYNPWSFYGFVRPKYQINEFKSVLSEYLGSGTTKNVTKPSAVLVFDTHKKSIAALSSWEENEYSKVDVVAATSAFPGYFSPVEIYSSIDDSRRIFIDGGLGACDPTLTTMHHAFRLFPRARCFDIVSIATGQADHGPMNHNDMKDLGLFGWFPHLPKLLSLGHMRAEEHFLSQSYQEFRNGSKYTRLNTVLDGKHDSIDNTSSENMLGLIDSAIYYLSQNNHIIEELALRLKLPMDDVDFTP